MKITKLVYLVLLGLAGLLLITETLNFETVFGAVIVLYAINGTIVALKKN